MDSRESRFPGDEDDSNCYKRRKVDDSRNGMDGVDFGTCATEESSVRRRRRLQSSARDHQEEERGQSGVNPHPSQTQNGSGRIPGKSRRTEYPQILHGGKRVGGHDP